MDFKTSQNTSATFPGGLLSYEIFWRDHQQWLSTRGYMLRSRYMPDWVPSWRGTRNPRERFSCEDGQSTPYSQIIDAIRMSDGAVVALKRFSKLYGPREGELGMFFSSDALRADSQNHCVPVYEVLDVPDDDETLIIVMPFLRIWDDPPFDTLGEIISFVQQIIEGLHFMHRHLVAHRFVFLIICFASNSTMNLRDCTWRNIMMDPSTLYPDLFHPVRDTRRRDFKGDAKHYTRTQRPVRYYWIDFGLTRRYVAEDMPPMEEIVQGGDRSVPEHQPAALEQNPTKSCNPFPTDVYYLGNVIRKHLIENNVGLEFLQPLISDMVHENPDKRPTMEEVLRRFGEIRETLTIPKLRSRLVPRDEGVMEGLIRSIGHWYRRIGYILKRTPAVPMPS
ncbi:hypothetical protein NEOLEDRAFT_1164410 [Neolentinus lepideus HHB14362 ss-1]|uniref:Protein kinase domain-containing protein n=1 Tax=Neolentinus lepideus HHB14362 ss-1 TaxID=1314782 RepID=A0A165Q1U3_9AGAM|nr:hypothetical protein NEOLEDRAFT_1164410 [Neolentinus lepideus HHB14362 ss-1]